MFFLMQKKNKYSTILILCYDPQLALESLYALRFDFLCELYRVYALNNSKWFIP